MKYFLFIVAMMAVVLFFGVSHGECNSDVADPSAELPATC